MGRPKLKSFTYRTEVGAVSGRTAVLTAAGRPPLPVASPPEFKGVPNLWTPEDLFVATIEACLMLTFVGVAEKRGLAFKSYDSTAEGLLEWEEPSYRFTRVVVRPRIVLFDSASVETAREVIERAHQTCLVANSVRCDVLVEPSFTIAPM